MQTNGRKKKTKINQQINQTTKKIYNIQAKAYQVLKIMNKLMTKYINQEKISEVNQKVHKLII